jgi:hypothetical protein
VAFPAALNTLLERIQAGKQKYKRTQLIVFIRYKKIIPELSEYY